METEKTFNIDTKVPAVGIAFWIIKICATTLGETGGDALSMTLGLGYLASTLIFLVFFGATMALQVSARRYHPAAYWAVVVATTTVGTTTSDYLDRTLGLGYVRASILLFLGVLALLYLWRRTTGVIEFENIRTRTNESFYWMTILVSNTLGTALGDFLATSAGFGFLGGALVFAGLLMIVALAHFFTSLSKSTLFWAAYVLTRPLGATLGDILTKPNHDGGLALGRFGSSFTLAAVMLVLIFVTHRRERRAQTPFSS